jgi:hypothetical protein
MKTAKLILIVCAFICAVILAFGLVGVIVTAVQYLFVLAVLLLVGTVAVKVLKKSDPPQLDDFKGPDKDLARVRRTLAEYKRKELTK